MPITKTAKKQLLVSRSNHERNQQIKTAMKTALKRARTAIEAGADRAAAKQAVDAAVRALHRSATKGVIKRENASRRAGRLMRAYNKAFAPSAKGASADPATEE